MQIDKVISDFNNFLQVDMIRLGIPYGKCEEGVKFQEMFGIRYTRQVSDFILRTK